MAGKKTVRIRNVSKVIASTEKFQRKALRGVVRGLLIWGHETITTAKEDFVPVKRGFLKATGDVDLVGTDEKPLVELSFGGESPADEYAIYVHEIPMQHRVGEDKYLEKPAMQEAHRLPHEIKYEIKKETGL